MAASQSKGKLTTTLLVLGIILIVAAGGLFASRVITGRMAESGAQKVMDRMEEMIPQYEAGDAAATGRGLDPLPVIEIDGTGFVGYLEIPSLDQKLPVATEEYEGKRFAFVESGSPVRGNFRIGGMDVHGVFGDLDRIKPSESIVFVDVDGIRYEYNVTGLGSIRVRDKQDHDLILCRGVSKNILFAVFGKLI